VGTTTGRATRRWDRPSNRFEGVHACCYEEHTIWIANADDCELHISGVAFKHAAKAWKLVNNAFPATLHPGASLAVVSRYHAIEQYARVREGSEGWGAA
jgi:hypothetical protein